MKKSTLVMVFCAGFRPWMIFSDPRQLMSSVVFVGCKICGIAASVFGTTCSILQDPSGSFEMPTSLGRASLLDLKGSFLG